MNKQQLANRIWASANKMRSKIEASEYKDYILGLIFYKFLSDNEVKLLKDSGFTDEMMPTLVENYEDEMAATMIKYCKDKIGYFIEYKYLFSTWLKDDAAFSIADLSEALNNFDRLVSEKYKHVYNKIFNTLQTGLSKLGENPSLQTRALKDLIKLIKDIPTDGSQDYDVLGYVYEYLISNFAANAGKKAGEFYTPHEVAMLMSEIVAEHHKDKQELEIYDPTSGSGSLLITIGKSISRHISENNRIRYYAQELKENTYNLTRMNLVMRGISPDNIMTRCADSLEEDWPLDASSTDIGRPLYVDAVVSNPPYSQNWNPTDGELDSRFKDYGVAPKSKADYAFLLHELHHIKPDGILTIVLPHGVLFRGDTADDSQGEGQIRRNLIEKNNIDAIIGLPANIFFGTGIPTLVMVLKQHRDNDDVLIINASKGFVKDGKQNRLRACDIKRIADTVRDRATVPGFSRAVSREEIRKNDYNLNIPRYVDSSEAPEKYDIYATMFGGIPHNELQTLDRYWQAFPSLQNELFDTNEVGYHHLKVENLKQVIENNQDVCRFADNYHSVFTDYADYLNRILVEPLMTVNVQQLQSAISDDLFRRLKPVPLVDRYQAYQFFSEDWIGIANDLEILQTEGFDVVRQVDPHMIFKDDNEVQDGWEGHVLPFELVQRELLSDDLAHIENMETRLETITDCFAKIIDSMSEEEMGKSILNEDNTKFVASEIKKELKQILDNIITPKIELLRSYPTKKKEKEQFVVDHPEIAWDTVQKGKNGCYGKTQINKLIYDLQIAYCFDEDSFEAKVKEVSILLEEEKQVDAELKECRVALIDATINATKSLDDNTAVELLRQKWITPLLASLAKIPDEVILLLIERVNFLVDKYATTYQDISNRINRSEQQLNSLIGELQGGSVDMLGLTEFRKTLKAEESPLRQMEAACLQSMFPKEGETVPKVRFKGFEGEWEKLKLGECGYWFKGVGISKSDLNKYGSTECIHYGELFIRYHEIIRNVYSRTNFITNVKSLKGDLLFPDSDVTPDGLARCSCILKEGVILGGGINILRLSKELNPSFMSYAINKEKKQIISRVTGTTVRHINSSALSEVIINVPKSLAEQQKIGQFFQSLDKKIELETQRLEKLKQIKSACLDKMFV